MFRKKLKQNLLLKSLLVTAIFVTMGSGLLSTDFALAQNCPSNTTVSGTTVTFVGELTDLGGDSATSVWFEYGQTTSYGQKTNETVLTQTGFYCITISGLSPSTTYHYRAAARNSRDTTYGEDKTFSTTSGPSVDLRINNSDGPITIPYNTSAVLSWNSSGNINSCSASNAWSGAKLFSGSETTGNLTSARTYTISCSSPGGSSSDSITVYVASNTPSVDTLTIVKSVRNLSDGTAWLNSVSADPGEKISFFIQVRANNATVYNAMIKDALPTKIIYKNNLKVNDATSSENLISGFNLGTLTIGETKTISFDAEVGDATQFNFGENNLINTAFVYTTSDSDSAVASVIVNKKAVAGVATEVSTGLTNNLLIDSFFLPLTIALSMIWFLKSRIVLFEKWLDLRKKQYNEYHSKKVLQLKIGRIKLQELLQRKII